MNKIELKGIEALAKECFPNNKINEEMLKNQLSKMRIVDNYKELQLPQSIDNKPLFIFAGTKNNNKFLYTVIYNKSVVSMWETRDSIYTDIDLAIGFELPLW